jgi:hypothetical protein
VGLLLGHGYYLDGYAAEVDELGWTYFVDLLLFVSSMLVLNAFVCGLLLPLRKCRRDFVASTIYF